MAVKIQLRRDTATNWQSANPILSQGELGLDTSANALKIGDGTTAWNDLDYVITDFDPSATYPQLRAQATTAADVGLGNVTNESKATMFNDPVFTGTISGIDATDVGLGNVLNVTQIPASEKGQPNGVATLNGSGLIPATQLPSFVDDTLEGYLNTSVDNRFYVEDSFITLIPEETGKIYVELSTNKTYRWSGSTYVEISASLIPNDGTLTVQTGTALTGSGTFSADQSTPATITINADIADQTEAETGTATDKLMTPERTSQAIKAIAIDGGAWVTPIVDITDVTFESVTFTIQNLEDYEVDVKYDLNTPPTANSITLAANTTSSELTISGLDAETNYILYAQSFLSNDAISENISNSFTTGIAPDDPFGAPGEQFFVASTTSTNPETSEEETSGFFGLVDQSTFGTTMTQVMTDLGITEGTAQNTSDSLLKFLHHGKIKYINQKTIRHTISWDHIQARLQANGGNVYGGAPITIGGRNYKVRLMRGFGQVSANTDGTGTPNYDTGPLMTISWGSNNAAGNNGTNWPTNTSPWNAASPNEWNTLIFPIHADSGTQTQTASTPDWASYPDADLQIGSGDGKGTWTQESRSEFPDTRVDRGRNSLAFKNSVNPNNNSYAGVGLRLVFELDETLGGGN